MIHKAIQQWSHQWYRPDAFRCDWTLEWPVELPLPAVWSVIQVSYEGHTYNTTVALRARLLNEDRSPRNSIVVASTNESA